MANLEFCDTHNMVAYLKKTEGSEGFYQIVDFLNASHIRYAFTENLTIYVSLINQFWQTATTRTLDNGEIELTATIDGKVNIVTEASVRRHLQLANSEGISSLPTTEIFEQLSLMRGLLRVLLGKTKQVEGMSKHKEIYATPSHTKKVFANMKREGKGFSGRDTPLFPTIMVQAQQEEGEGSAIPTDPHPTPSITQPSSSQP
ncbi:hypothetical protein Tco_0975285 [Tanacetum coccineum]|uniref:Uncharacterized protein n=1 Tax=Tanacetum coccineum TaxID=301880 RepID=A0ABQ5EDY7_9ASTR